MKNKKILLILLLLTLLIGGGFYYYGGQFNQGGVFGASNPSHERQETPSPQPVTNKNSICTIEKGVKGQNGYSSSIVYISAQGDMRMDMVNRASGMDIMSHVIVLQDAAARVSTTYDWSDMPGAAFKSVTKLGASNSDGYATGGGMMVDMTFGMNCVPWTPDQSKFIPPNTVHFEIDER